MALPRMVDGEAVQVPLAACCALWKSDRRRKDVAPLSDLSHPPTVADILVRPRGLNLHTPSGTCTSNMRVCQFRHDRKDQSRSN
jgi:hypothetical protein